MPKKAQLFGEETNVKGLIFEIGCNFRHGESLACMVKMIEMGSKKGFTMTLNVLNELFKVNNYKLSAWMTGNL